MLGLRMPRYIPSRTDNTLHPDSSMPYSYLTPAPEALSHTIGPSVLPELLFFGMEPIF